MNEENLYKSILNEALQNAYRVYRNYGYVKKETEEKQARITEEKKKRAKEERLKLYKLDPDNNESDKVTYNDIRESWIKIEEGSRTEVYLDNAKKPKRTVGIGFNMDRGGARTEWDNAFKDYPNKPDFDKVYHGKPMDKDQIEKLFKHSISIREKDLINKLGQATWNNLKPNERLALESANYNNPSLVGKKLTEHVQNYAKTGKKEDLEQAYQELAKMHRWADIQNIIAHFNQDEMPKVNF